MHVRYIYWFAYYNPDLPSVRYRATYPLEKLREAYGVEYALAYPGYDLKSIFCFLRMFFSALFFRKKDSVIVVQKLYTNRIYAFALKTLVFFRRKNTQYDLDDAEYLVYPPGTIHYFMKNCASCSLASEALVQYAKRYNPQVFLSTSPVINHGQRKKRGDEIFTIGWIGCYGGAHQESLEQFVFPAICKLGFSARLVLLGVTEDETENKIRKIFENHPGIQLEIPRDTNWLNEISVYEQISRFDIGLTPLLDIEMHRSKSAFKLKQYFSCGVPALGTATGENGRFLIHESNGLICDSVEDYFQGLNRFREMNQQEYQKFSEAALGSVNQFNLDSYCNKLLDFYSGGNK